MAEHQARSVIRGLSHLQADLKAVVRKILLPNLNGRKEFQSLNEWLDKFGQCFHCFRKTAKVQCMAEHTSKESQSFIRGRHI